MQVHLVDAWFDAPLWDQLRAALKSPAANAEEWEVIPYSPEPLNTNDPARMASDALDRLRGQLEGSDPGDHLIVATGEGAGTGAWLTAEGLAGASVLIDPPTACLLRMDGGVVSALPADSPELMAAKVERLEPFSALDPDAEIPDEMHDVMEGAFTGDPVLVRRASLQKQEFRRRRPMDRGPASQDEPTQRVANWVEPWSSGKGDIEVWLSSPHDKLEQYLRQRYQGGSVKLFDWPIHPVLSAPDEVARQLIDWARSRSSR